MNPKHQKEVVSALERIDFYDKDFTDAMKQIKLINWINLLLPIIRIYS